MEQQTMEPTSNVVTVDTEVLDPIEPTEQPAEAAPEEPVAEEPSAEEPVAEVPKEPEDNHDVRRMKKFMQRAFEAEAKLEAKEKVQQELAERYSRVPKEPQPTQFATDAEYYAAMTDFKTNQVRQEFESKFQQIKRQEVGQVFAKKAEEARKELPDFDDVLTESTVMFSPETQQEILESPVAAHLAYTIAKDEDYAQKLAAMSPTKAAREIGKLEAKIEAELGRKTVPVAKAVSKAPAPIKPVSAKADAALRDPSKLSDEAWMLWRRQTKYKLKK